MRTRSTVLALLTAAAVAACSGAPPAPTASSGASAPADQPTSSPLTGGPTPALSAPPQPGGSGPLPPFSFAIPSFAPDTTLEAAFPTEIDGQPVTGIESVSFLAFLQAFETDPEVVAEFAAAMQGIGVDPAAVGFASADVTVGDDTLELQAVRTPGGSAASALDALTALDPPDPAPTITDETIGGKPVRVATLEDGEEEFVYANGDLAWLLPGADRAQAEVIFAALP